MISIRLSDLRIEGFSDANKARLTLGLAFTKIPENFVENEFIKF
jgi:hypothetical protein